MKKFKEWALILAETFDVWRIVPRMIVMLYGFLVWSMYTWYKTIPTYVQTKCDAALIELLMGRSIPFDKIRDMACYVVGTTGGPTTEQTTFVTIIISLSSAIFALYTNSGKKWDGNSKSKE
jgi:hypothetical protein